MGSPGQALLWLKLGREVALGEWHGSVLVSQRSRRARRTHEPPGADPPPADSEDGEGGFVVQAALAC
jgi:hypothetical protein